MDRNEIVRELKEGLCRVDFTKVNGESRVMLCTLNFDDIPVEAHPKNNDSVDKWPENLVKAYDVDAKGWRSFKMDSVNTFAKI